LPNSSHIITVNGTIKASATVSSTPRMMPIQAVRFVDGNASADFSATTIVRPDREPRVRGRAEFSDITGGSRRGMRSIG
jgi:hypothetical protein